MLAYARQHLSAPLLTGLPFGHIADRLTLPVGARARLESSEHGYSLRLDAYPTLATAFPR